MPFDGIHTDQTTTVVLHGRLAKVYGRRHQLGVRSAAEAAHALSALHPSFRADFQDGHYRVIRGTVATGVRLSESMLTMRVGNAREIHFVPVARGGKSSGGTGKAILGAVILIAAVVAAIPTGGGSLAFATPVIAGITAGQIAFFGAAILLAGISQIISPQPKNNSTQTDPRQSFGLSGNTNSTVQGSVIPAVYGRTRVGSVVASFGYEAVEYSGVPASTTVGTAGASPPVDVSQPSETVYGTGSSGGKGGGGGGASEAPNTLRSNAIVRVIDILSEGPIGGLVDGAKSIFFNGTPLMAADGTYNFLGVSWQVRLGYPDQDPVDGFPAAEETLQVSYQVKKQQPKIQTITSGTANAARVTIRIPSLVTQNSTNGNLEAGPALAYQIEVRPIGGAWQTVVLENIVGQKCTSPYQRSYRFALPDFGTVTSWDVRMTRLTDDSTTTNVQDDTYFDAITLITDHKLIYPNTAYIAFQFDASAFGSQVPTRAYEIDGILCRVPANYDALGHTYATSGPGTTMGTWDGASWKLATTSNPCWCAYNMFENGRYGAGIADSALTYTRYDLFTISQYCDGLVPTGYKDVNGNDTAELRYAVNVAMTTQEDAFKVFQSMVSAFRGMTYWGAGRVVVTADMPTVPSSVLNQANVIDGVFTYEGTALKTRHTVARVAWQDPQNAYQTTIEVVEDFDQVVTLGQVATDIVAFGCTSRGLAHRLGKWLLDTEKTQTETVTTQTGLEHLAQRPGDVTIVADPAYAGVRMGGRCPAGSTTTRVKLDSSFPTSGELLYKLTVTLPDGSVASDLIVDAIDYDPAFNGSNCIAVLRATLPLAPAAAATWVLSSSGDPGPHGPSNVYAVAGREFRVLALAEPQRGTFSLVGVNHDPNKYARVEYGLKFDPTPYSILNQLLATPLPPPSNVTARDYIDGVGTTTLVRATVSFTPARDVRVLGAEVRAVGPEQRVMATNGSTADFDGLQLGTYVFGVRSTGRDGHVSVWIDSDPVVVDGVADAPTAVTGLTAKGGALRVALSWNRSTARDVLHYEIWRAGSLSNGQHPFPTGSFQMTGTPEANGATLLAHSDSTTYVDAGDVLGPDEGWGYWVRPINTTLVPGAFAGPAIAVTTYYLTDNLEDAIKNTAPIAQALLGNAPTFVDSLPDVGTAGQYVVLKTDGKLYRWDATLNGGQGGWYQVVMIIPDSAGKIPASIIKDIQSAVIGQSLTQDQIDQVLAAVTNENITTDQITSLVGSKVTGLLSNAQIQAGRVYDVDPVTGQVVVGVSVGKLLGSLSATKIVDVNPVTGQIQQGISAASLLGTLSTSSLPAIPTTLLTGDILAANSATLSLTSSRITGSLAATKITDIDPVTGNPVVGVSVSRLLGSIPTSKLTGGISASSIVDVDPLSGNQITGLQAARIAGQVVASQIASLTAGQVTGQLTDAQLAAISAAKLTGKVTAGQIASIAASQLTGTLTSDQIASLAAAKLAGQITTTQITDGAISTGKLAAAAVTADQIAASAVTASKLAIGSGNNLISNSCCAITADGWLNGPYSSVPGSIVATDPNGGLIGYGAGHVVYSGVLGSGTIDTSWAPTGAFNKGVPCAPGSAWEGQVQVITAACHAELHLFWFDAAGIGCFPTTVNPGAYPETVGTSCGITDSGLGGATLDKYTRLTVIGRAPVNAAYVTLGLRMLNGITAGQFLVFTQAGLAPTAPNATQVSDWAPGGVTSIQGGLIATDAVDARIIASRTILAENIAAGTLTATEVAVGTLTGDRLAAATITGTEIAGGTITGDLIAGRSVSAQVLTAGSITATELAASSVTAEKLTIGSPSNFISNSCWSVSTDGWISDGTLTPILGSGLEASWAPAEADGGLLVQCPTIPQGMEHDAITLAAAGSNGRWFNAAVPVVPGRTYEAQVRYISGVGSARLFLIFADENNLLGAPASDYAYVVPPNGTRRLSDWSTLVARGVAPAGSKYASIMVRMLNPGPGANACSIFLTQALLGETVPNALQALTWVAGGTTSVSGGQIKTNTIIARNIAGATITGDKIAANAITTRELAVGSGSNSILNSCFAVSTEGWSLLSYGGNSNAVLGTCASTHQSFETVDGVGVVDFHLAAGGYCDLTYDRIACRPGDTIEAQALLLPIGASAAIYVEYLDISGAHLAYGASFSNWISPQSIPAAPAQGTLQPFSPAALVDRVPDGAASVLFRIRTSSSSIADGYLFVTRTGLGVTVTGATQVSAWTPGGGTSIGGGVIRTEAIVARNLAAGSVTADKIVVAASANVIGNPTCQISSWGWNLESNAPGSSIGAVLSGAVDAGYALKGEGSGFVSAATLATGQFMQADWSPDSSNGVPCLPGEWWEGQAYLAAHRCFANARIEFWSATQVLSTIEGDRSVAGGGNALIGYTLSWCKGQAPAGTTAVRLVLVGRNDGGSDIGQGQAGQSPYIFWTRAVLGRSTSLSRAQGAQPQPYQIGGSTQIVGGQIATDAVTARIIAAGAVTADELAANSVTSSKITAGAVVADSLSAGAVTTAKLDAGAVTAEKLAIGSNANVISNPSCAISTDGWLNFSATTSSMGSNFSGFFPTGEGGGYISLSGSLAVGQSLIAVYQPTSAPGVPCVPGTWYEAQAKVAGHRVANSVQIQFLKADGSAADGDGSNPWYVTSGRGVAAGGTALASFALLWVKARAPSGAVFVRLLIYGSNDGGGGYAASNGTDGGVSPFMFWTQASLGVSTPVPMAQSSPQPYAPGGVTQITGGLIQSDTIVGRHLVAGSVSSDKLTIGSGNSQIWNPCCSVSTDGWSLGPYTSVSGGSIVVATGIQSLVGYGSGILACGANIGAGYIDVCWASNWTPETAVTCSPGTAWEGQVQVLTAACHAELHLFWFDAAGIGCFPTSSHPDAYPETVGSSVGVTDTGTGSVTLDRYTRLTVIGRAPSNAAFVTLGIRMLNGLAAGQFLIFTQAALAPTVANATQVSAYAPGGATQIVGGMISTNAITSRVIAANQITSRELAVGNSTNLLQNSCCAVSTDGWSATAWAGASIGQFAPTSSIYLQFNTQDGCAAIETTLPPGGYVDINSDPVAVLAGTTIEAQAMLMPLGSSGQIFIHFIDAAGGHVGYSASSNIVGQNASLAGAGTLAQFGQAGVFAVVPAGAASAQLLIRFSNAGSGLAAGYAVFSRTYIGTTVSGASQLSPWAAGGVTAIGGGIIKTNAVVARNLAAGSVTADKIVVAASANVIGNPTCPGSAWGWVLASVAPNAKMGSVYGDALSPAIYALAGEGSGVMVADSLSTSQYMATYWDPDGLNGIPCSPGEWWEGQALLANNRCFGQVQIQFLDGGSNLIGEANGNRVVADGGSELPYYGLSWCKAQAPAGTVRVKFIVYGLNDNGGDIRNGTPGVSPYLWFTRCVLGRSTSLPKESGAQPQPYQIGGVTQVVGGQIKTNAVTARAIAAGAITAEKLSVGSATNVITNSCGNPTAAGWSGGVYSFAPNEQYGLDGYGSAYANLGVLSPGTYADYWWAPRGSYLADGIHVANYDASVPCSPGELWEAQAQVQTHRCSVSLFLIFTGLKADGSGYEIKGAPSTGDQCWNQPGNGNTLDTYHRISVRGVVPAGATLVTLMFRMANGAAAQAVFTTSAGTSPYLIWTQAGLGPALTNVPIMPWSPGGVSILSGGLLQTGTVDTLQLAAGAVKAVTIDANAVTASKIAAGAITAEKATFGFASNVIWNPCMDQGSDGWVVFDHPDLGTPNAGNLVMGAAANINQNFSLTGSGSGFAQWTSPSALVFDSQFFGWNWSPTADIAGVPVAGGKQYGGAALVIAGNGASVHIDIVWLDYNRTYIAQTSPDIIVSNNAGANGLAEYEYQRVTTMGVSPSNAAFAQFRIYAFGASGGASEPFFAFTKAQFGQTPAGATVVGEWQPGGVTAISGNMIKTGTMDAAKINAGTIAAATGFIQTLTATLITATNIKAQLVNTNKLTSGEIDVDHLIVGGVQAGAIGADEIASNAIFARHLGAEQILTSSAQIGVGTIQAANIGALQVKTAAIDDLTVAGEKIGVSAVTAVASGSAAGGSIQAIAVIPSLNVSPHTNGVVLFFRAFMPGVSGATFTGGGEGDGGS